MTTTVPVRVEFGPGLAPLATSPEAASLVGRLTAQLDALLDGLGVRADSAVELATVDSTRPLRVRVHGTVQPYVPDLLLRTWLAVAPPDWRDLYRLEPPPMQPPFPARWLMARALDLAAGGEAGWALLATYVERLVIQVVLDRPLCLLSNEQIREQSNGLPLTEQELGFLLRRLLGLGVSIADRERIEKLVHDGEKIGRPLEDTIEAVFTELRSHRIAVHVHPWTLSELLPGAPADQPFSVHSPHIHQDLRDLFGEMEKTFFSTFGFLLPDLVWVANPALAERTVVVQIDRWWGLPMPMLSRGERLVDATAEELRTFRARDAVHPVTGARCSLVHDDAKEALEQAGHTTWGPVDFVLLNVLGDLSQRPERLFGLEELEFQLTSLRPGDEPPALVDATLAKYSLGDLTRVRRALIEERLGLRGLPLILEALLSYSTVPLNDEGLVVLDDRLLVVNGSAPGQRNGWPSYYEHVRRRLTPYIRHKYAKQDNTVEAYRLDHGLDARLNRLSDEPFSDAELERLRDAVWTLEANPERSALISVVVATTQSRPLLRGLLAPELPWLPIVSHSELGPDVHIQEIGLISTP